MQNNDYKTRQHEAFSSMLELNDEQDDFWNAEELPSIWQHQLGVEYTLGEKRFTMGELLAAETPDLDGLKEAKRISKVERVESPGLLSDEVFTLLYYLSIVLALRHHGERISSLRDPELEAGIEWARNRPWLDEATRRVFS
ncbi:MAG: hypothetical protein AAF492_24030 [Verrucomicrobiota bacterium]